MKGIVVCLLLACLVGSIAADMWFEEEPVKKVVTREEPSYERKAQLQADVFETLTKEEAAELKDPLASTTNSGMMHNVMLKAFDEDGDGLLDSKELAKINSQAWLDFHKSMTQKVFGALGQVKPDISHVKEQLSRRHKALAEGRTLEEVSRDINSKMFNHQSLQDIFQHRIREATNAAGTPDWREADANAPHLELHAKTVQQARKLLELRNQQQ
ncbi:hypothetical protein QOT17_003607 [Balamuthia mandrillaris]